MRYGRAIAIAYTALTSRLAWRVGYNRARGRTMTRLVLPRVLVIIAESKLHKKFLFTIPIRFRLQ